ncbi:MAG: response regulator transcription factor [Actinomycetota bacterium]|nr:response regulator transcription factor [Actinomycetota bacterium]
MKADRPRSGHRSASIDTDERGVPTVPAGDHRTGRRLLLIEDDPAVQRVLTIALCEEGFHLDVASTARHALHLFGRLPIDVVLLDLMLPDLDGLELCRRLRKVSDVPLIMVTARADSHDMVAGLESGADDYIVKPFVAKVLAARVRALLRRAQGARPERVVAAGALEVRPAEAVVLAAGEPVQLTRTEFRLLVTLAERLDEVVSRDELLQKVWGYDYLGDGRLVDVHMRRLRAKVEPDPSQPRHLITVRGLGYRLCR